MPEAELRIESGGAAARGWNVPVAAALAWASALSHPDRPQIAWPRPEASPERESFAPVELADAAADAQQQRVLDGTESGTRPRSDSAVTRETPLIELIEHVEASRDSVPASQLTPNPRPRIRSRVRLAAGTCIAALTAAIGPSARADLIREPSAALMAPANTPASYRARQLRSRKCGPGARTSCADSSPRDDPERRCRTPLKPRHRGLRAQFRTRVTSSQEG